MRPFCRILGWFLILVAVALLGRDLIAGFERGSLKLAPLGEVWFKLHAASLNMLQAGIERNVSPELWDYAVAPVLRWPAEWVFAIPGVVLILLCRNWGGRRRRFR